MLWVDKHRPTRLKSLTFHPKISAQLEALTGSCNAGSSSSAASSCAAAASTMPHLLFYGPSGCGKKTRIAALLRAIYGPGAERLRLDRRTFQTPTKRNIEVNMICSNYHVEMSPGDAGLDDRFVVQDVIKEMASSRSLTAASSGDGAASTSGGIMFKVVVLVEVHRLTRQAQAALRRTMERYAATCRLILVCNNPCKIIEPLRSRCLAIRVPSPTTDEICSMLQTVATKEKITLPQPLAISIARHSNRNARRALLTLEACHVQHRHTGGLTATSTIQTTDWEMYIAQLASDITAEQSPQKLLAAREKLYELLLNCIPASVILKTLSQELCRNLDEELKVQVVEHAAFYEHRLCLASNGKEVFHLEAFVAKFMALYKKYLNDMFA